MENCVSWQAKLLVVFLYMMFALPGVQAHPSSLCVELFQARERLDSVFMKAPFVIVNPIYKPVMEGLYEFTPEGQGVKLKRLDGKKREIVRAPYVVMAGRGGTILQSGYDVAHLHKYYGQITVRKRNPRPKSKGAAGLLAVNLVDSFNYVASVVGGETTRQFGKEALKAQAVLVYTRLWPKGKLPTIADTTDEMVYLGAEHERADVIDAVNEVDRCKLLYHDRPAQAFFHACCAGRTSKGTDIFGKNAEAMVYLKSRPCNYCRGSPLYGITVKQIPARTFTREIADGEPKVIKTDEAKRIVSAEICKGGKKEELSGYQLWLRIGQRLGWDKAPGTRYQVKQTASGYTIKSSGGGHGVGLCQWGAQGLARQNKSYIEILQYYFPGTTVEKHAEKASRN